MKREAHRVQAEATRELEQSDRFRQRRAELLGQVHRRVCVAEAEPEQQIHAPAVGREFGELAFVVEHEGIAAVGERALNLARCFDRMCVQHPFGRDTLLPQQSDLARARYVEMAALFEQGAQNRRLRQRLDRVVNADVGQRSP